MRTQENQHSLLIDRLSSKPDLIQRIEDRLIRDDKIGINIGMQEGLLLKSICSQAHIGKVVEIGTQYGCSAAWMAMGLGGRGKIWTFEKDPVNAEQARETFGDPGFQELQCSVELFEGAALDNLPSVEANGPFDLIFIDANKAGYWDYWQWAKSNIKHGGLVVADNVYLFGTVFLEECPEKTPKKMWNVMRQLLDDAFADSSFDSSIVPTDEGLLLATKKL